MKQADAVGGSGHTVTLLRPGSNQINVFDNPGLDHFFAVMQATGSLVDGFVPEFAGFSLLDNVSGTAFSSDALPTSLQLSAFAVPTVLLQYTSSSVAGTSAQATTVNVNGTLTLLTPAVPEPATMTLVGPGGTDSPTATHADTSTLAGPQRP